MAAERSGFGSSSPSPIELNRFSFKGLVAMGRVWLAFRVFFDVLFSTARADQIRQIEAVPPPAGGAPEHEEKTEPLVHPPVKAAPVAQSGRSDALTLLEALQREARLIDFLQEEIASYSDQQIGSAVREVHRGCREVLQRMFSIVPVLDSAEGSPVTVQATDEAARIRLVGNVVDTRPVTGTLVHSGWRAERCDLPVWTGTSESKQILSPAEVELAGQS